LVRKVTQLAVATLAQYSTPAGQVDLAVGRGDLRQGAAGLRLMVANLGRQPLVEPFVVAVSHCGADSTGCRQILRTQYSAGLAPGAAAALDVPWTGLGEALFRVEVDPDDQIVESSSDNNRVYERLYVQPEGRIVLYPNPFHSGEGRRMVLAGLPLNAAVRIFAADGTLVWEAREDDAGQRRLGAAQGEVWWLGVNGSQAGNDSGAPLVGSGVYVYTVSASTGQLLARDKLAVVRAGS